MQSEGDARGRIADMLEAIAGIEAAISGHDATTFVADRKARDAVLWNLTVLGEAVRGGHQSACVLDSVVQGFSTSNVLPA